MTFKRPGYLRAVLIMIVAMAPAVCAQQAPRWSEQELIAAAREIMTTTRYCALITTDARGATHARTMDAFAPEENMIVWLATNPHSQKVIEIRRHPRVTFYYFDRDKQAYVTLYGSARLVNDANEKARHWKAEWKDFYPNKDKDYLLIQVRPLKLEVVNTTKSSATRTPGNRRQLLSSKTARSVGWAERLEPLLTRGPVPRSVTRKHAGALARPLRRAPFTPLTLGPADSSFIL
jgi:general stress protein 26